jgi:ribosomal-protein-alanine N-acetyltransferase
MSWRGRLRALQVTDADWICALHQEAFACNGWPAEAFTRLLALPAYFGIGALSPTAEEGELPVGILLAALVAGECEVITLAVAPRARHRGIGRALVEAALRRAEAADATVIHLEVSAANRPALSLYEALGFAPLGRRAGYYLGAGAGGEDAIRMARSLTPGR